MDSVRKEFEVRETNPRDERPDLHELVFRTVYDAHSSQSSVERLTLAELARVRDTISAYLGAHPDVESYAVTKVADVAVSYRMVADGPAYAVARVAEPVA